MIETPHITDSQAQRMAFIPITVPREQIQTVMGPAISEVYGTLAAQGVAPVGPWFSHHKSRPTDVFDFAACVPVAATVAPSGRVQAGELPARGKVARTVYQGDYARLGEAWGEFIQWVEANGHQGAQDLWERYLVGPESSSKPEDWRTELNLPLL